MQLEGQRPVEVICYLTKGKELQEEAKSRSQKFLLYNPVTAPSAQAAWKTKRTFCETACKNKGNGNVSGQKINPNLGFQLHQAMSLLPPCDRLVGEQCAGCNDDGLE